METVAVYRIEHPEDGLGPYRHRDIFGCVSTLSVRMDEVHSYEESLTHPHPCSDGLDFPAYSELCGFEDLESLYDWFDGFLEELQSDGYLIALYIVNRDQVQYGYHQVVFDPCDSLKKIMNGEVWRKLDGYGIN